MSNMQQYERGIERVVRLWMQMQKADNSYIECDSTRMKEKLVSIVSNFFLCDLSFHLNRLLRGRERIDFVLFLK